MKAIFSTDIKFPTDLETAEEQACSVFMPKKKVPSKIFCHFSSLKILHEYLLTVKYEMNMSTP